MNLFIYFCIPLVVTGQPTPGTYGGEIDGQNLESSGTEAFSQYDYGAGVGYKGSSLNEFALDSQGEYYRKPTGANAGYLDKPNTNALQGDDHPSFAAANIYSRLRDKAIGSGATSTSQKASGLPFSDQFSPQNNYGIPSSTLQNRPSLLKLSQALIAAQLANAQYEQNLKSVAAYQAQAISHNPLAQIAPQPHLGLLNVPQAGPFFQAPLYQNVLVPLYTNPLAHPFYQGGGLEHGVGGLGEQLSVAQHVVPTLHKNIAPVLQSPTVLKTAEPILQVPLFKPSVAPIAPILKTVPGVEADIVRAIEEPVPAIPLVAKTHVHPYQQIVSPYLDSAHFSPKTPKVLLQKVKQPFISPVLTEKAVLKGVLAPAFKTHIIGYQKAIVKAPMLAHFVHNGYLEPGLPGKILASQKSLVKALIASDTGKTHYGHGHHGKHSVGLPPGTSVELLPSLSYGFSYSFYPKSHSYGHHHEIPVGPHDHGHHHEIPVGPHDHGHHHHH